MDPHGQLFAWYMYWCNFDPLKSSCRIPKKLEFPELFFRCPSVTIKRSLTFLNRGIANLLLYLRFFSLTYICVHCNLFQTKSSFNFSASRATRSEIRTQTLFHCYKNQVHKVSRFQDTCHKLFISLFQFLFMSWTCRKSSLVFTLSIHVGIVTCPQVL